MNTDKRTTEYKDWLDNRTKELRLEMEDYRKAELIDYVIEIDETYEEHLENMMDDDIIDIITEYESVKQRFPKSEVLIKQFLKQ